MTQHSIIPTSTYLPSISHFCFPYMYQLLVGIGDVHEELFPVQNLCYGQKSWDQLWWALASMVLFSCPWSLMPHLHFDIESSFRCNSKNCFKANNEQDHKYNKVDFNQLQVFHNFHLGTLRVYFCKNEGSFEQVDGSYSTQQRQRKCFICIGHLVIARFVACMMHQKCKTQ